MMQRCALAPIAARLHAALSRQPRAEHIAWTIDIPETIQAPFDEFDLTELLGNLMDNAMKWAKERIVLRAGHDAGKAFLYVEDDGPGIPDKARASVFERGGRLDAEKPGTGLGLSIANEMAVTHNCELTLGRASLGGLQVRLTWPQINE
jgi:signal transduction histidine kinase